MSVNDKVKVIWKTNCQWKDHPHWPKRKEIKLVDAENVENVSPPLNDVQFNEANKVFKAQCVQLKKDGQAIVQHKPPILFDDLKKLYESSVFNSDHPKTLLNKVFFEIMLCFCGCGCQNL